MTKDISYVRCSNCSTVYEASESKCPNCNSDTSINESDTNEEVFNLKD